MSDDRFAVVPASYVYLLRETDQGTEVLLQLRQGTPYMDGHWAAAAAGHVERGETAYDAAHREALEELGVSDLDLDFAFTMQRTQFADPIDERVDFFFTADRGAASRGSWSRRSAPRSGGASSTRCRRRWSRTRRTPCPGSPAASAT